MKKIVLTFSLSLMVLANYAQNLFTSKTAQVSFFSKTPVEDIKAECNTANALLNTEGSIAFVINNTSFEFPNKLMQEHFNEKYMESDKYPMSTFKGKINEKIDYTKDGTYEVTTSGTLNIHGVEQERTIPGTINIKNGVINLASNFKVKVADHKITIPKLVVAKIAEEIDVKVNAELLPKK
ncbi:MAG: YceI family protein [Bacteroidia bacterium]